jgi:hypothetical protein
MKDWVYKPLFGGHKAVIAGIALLIASASPGFAFKVEKLPFMSDFHIGVVNGIGMGINIGVRALYPFGDVMAGGELEQIMSDVNYAATLNASRFGLVAGLDVYENTQAYVHFGYFNFMASDFFLFTNTGGNVTSINGSENYKGLYMAISVDRRAWDFDFTLKLTTNNIYDRGAINEMDLNIGREIKI